MRFRDVSRAGHELSRAEVEDLAGPVSLRALLAHRVHAEVAAHNRAPARLFTGLVQPLDAVRYSAGSQLPEARPLDADRCVRAVEEAAGAGVLRVRVDGGELLGDLDAVIDADAVTEVTVVLARPVVAAV